MEKVTIAILLLSLLTLLYVINYLKNKLKNTENSNNLLLEKKEELVEEYSNQDKELKSKLKIVENKLKEVEESLSKAKEDLEEKDQLIEAFKQALDKKTLTNKQTLEYLDQFFNNGIFYDQENDTMVLISNLIRVEDFDTKEPVEIEEKKESEES